MIAYVDNDHLLRLENARALDLATGQAVYLTASASVAVTVYDGTGIAVPGEIWPLALTYVAGSQGLFLGVLRNELALVAGHGYTLHAEVDNGPDQYGEWDMPLVVLTRSA